MVLPPALEQLVSQLARLPGIGEKTATRLALFVIAHHADAYALSLAQALQAVAERVGLCGECFNVADSEQCPICRDPHRDLGLLCVVEGVADLFAIERAAVFRGRYHVLHGVIAPLKGVGPDHLRIPALLQRVRCQAIREVIVATNVDMEGEATAVYLAHKLRDAGVRVSRIATGIPMGSDLEFIDQLTLTRAIDGRLPM